MNTIKWEDVFSKEELAKFRISDILTNLAKLEPQFKNSLQHVSWSDSFLQKIYDAKPEERLALAKEGILHLVEMDKLPRVPLTEEQLAQL